MTAYAETVDFYLEGKPTDYRVWTWSESEKSIVHQGVTTRNFDIFKFSIPSQYVVRNNDGEVDVKASLVKWRESTPVAAGNPRTLNDIGYYPFTDEHGSIHYVALEHIQDNSQKYPNINLNFSGAPEISGSVILDASEEEPKVAGTEKHEPNSPEDLAARAAMLERSAQARKNPNPSLEVLEENPNKEATRPPQKKVSSGAQSVLNEIEKIKANPSRLQCASNNGNSAHCMICNCYYESRGESYSGMVAVNRTVMTRTVRQGFPSSACGVIWAKSKSRGRWTAAFSWTLEGGKSRGRSSSSVKTCANATAEAVKLGTWQWDHFYNPNVVTPSWAAAMIRRNGSKTYGNHKFLNSGAALKKTSRKTGATYNKTSSQRGTE